MTQTISIVLLAISIIFLCIRFIGLSSVPYGFFPDEASIGYDAFSILEIGKDFHGRSFPIYFESFGEYKNPIFIYSLVPLIKLFGLKLLTIRLASAIWGLVAVFASLLIAREILRYSWQILLVVVIVASTPWLFLLNRLALEVTAAPALFLLGYYFLARFCRTKRASSFYIFIVWQTLFFYSYSATRFQSIAFFLAAIILFRRALKFKDYLVIILLHGIILLPAILWELNNPGTLMQRFSEVSAFSIGDPNSVLTVFTQYLSHFDLRFLFTNASYTGSHLNAHYPPFFLVLIIPLIAGIFYSKHSTLKSYTLAILFLAPIPAALSINTPSNLRSSGFLTVIIIFMIMGLKVLTSKRYGMNILVFIVFVLVGQFSYFVYDYFSNFNSSYSDLYYGQELEAVEVGLKSQSPYIIGNQLHSSIYANYLFLAKTPPQDYLTNGMGDINILSVDSIETYPAGTYIYFYEACNQYQDKLGQAARLVYENEKSCVYTQNSFVDTKQQLPRF